MTIGLVLDGWDEPDLTAEKTVVEPVDVFGEGDLEVLDALPWSLVADGLGLERRVERFGEGVVVEVAATPGRSDDPCLREAPGVADSELLNASIAVMDEVGQVRPGAFPRPAAHFESIDGQVIAH